MNTKKSTVAPMAFVGFACSLEYAQKMSVAKSKNPRHEERKKLTDEFIGPMWTLPKKKEEK